ncbi:mitochodrial transcription termination factor [Tanacetum coccineum]|uniref:Mitochodrial transcription termination factor n=1 Tax=Tanacetum coccineum TaxID=301880 RepID=A0ABQ5FLB4_9ASTR
MLLLSDFNYSILPTGLIPLFASSPIAFLSSLRPPHQIVSTSDLELPSQEYQSFVLCPQNFLLVTIAVLSNTEIPLRLCFEIFFWKLGSDYEKKINDNILVLRKYGVSSHKIESLLLKNPGCLLQRVEWLDGVVKKVEPLLGIRPDSPQIVRKREFASCLRRLEGTIKASLEWFKENPGYGGAYLSTHPKLLVYSLEKRVVPRESSRIVTARGKISLGRTVVYRIVMDCFTNAMEIEMGSRNSASLLKIKLSGT